MLATIATLLDLAALVVGRPWAAAPGFTDRFGPGRGSSPSLTRRSASRAWAERCPRGARAAALQDLQAALFDPGPAPETSQRVTSVPDRDVKDT